MIAHSTVESRDRSPLSLSARPVGALRLIVGRRAIAATRRL